MLKSMLLRIVIILIHIQADNFIKIWTDIDIVEAVIDDDTEIKETKLVFSNTYDKTKTENIIKSSILWDLYLPMPYLYEIKESKNLLCYNLNTQKIRFFGKNKQELFRANLSQKNERKWLFNYSKNKSSYNLTGIESEAQNEYCTYNVAHRNNLDGLQASIFYYKECIDMVNYSDYIKNRFSNIVYVIRAIENAYLPKFENNNDGLKLVSMLVFELCFNVLEFSYSHHIININHCKCYLQPFTTFKNNFKKHLQSLSRNLKEHNVSDKDIVIIDQEISKDFDSIPEKYQQLIYIESNLTIILNDVRKDNTRLQKYENITDLEVEQTTKLFSLVKNLFIDVHSILKDKFTLCKNDTEYFLTGIKQCRNFISDSYKDVYYKNYLSRFITLSLYPQNQTDELLAFFKCVAFNDMFNGWMKAFLVREKAILDSIVDNEKDKKNTDTIHSICQFTINRAIKRYAEVIPQIITDYSGKYFDLKIDKDNQNSELLFVENNFCFDKDISSKSINDSKDESIAKTTAKTPNQNNSLGKGVVKLQTSKKHTISTIQEERDLEKQSDAHDAHLFSDLYTNKEEDTVSSSDNYKLSTNDQGEANLKKPDIEIENLSQSREIYSSRLLNTCIGLSILSLVLSGIAIYINFFM